MNKLPSFMCVGAQKAGTTTLHDLLNQHPMVFLPKIKETKFFQLDEKFDRGVEYYQSEFFNNAKNEQILGEIDPEYMYFDYVPKRIYNIFGKNIKFIFILRNPAARAYSHYLMSKKRGYESLIFFEALNREKYRIAKNDIQDKNKSNIIHFSYIDRGYYVEQIKKYLEFFPKENMMFVLFENDFLKDQKNTFKKICDFIGVDDFDFDFTKKSNFAKGAKSVLLSKFLYSPNKLKDILRYMIPVKIKNKIFNYFMQFNEKELKNSKLTQSQLIDINNKYFFREIKELEKILNRDLSEWLKDKYEKK